MTQETPPQQECIYCLSDMKDTSIFNRTCPHSAVRGRDLRRREGISEHFPMPWKRP